MPINLIYIQASSASSQIWPLDCSLATTVKQRGREKKWRCRLVTLWDSKCSLLPSLTWASLAAQQVKNLPAMQETWILSAGWEDSPGEVKGYLLQYSGLENSTECIVHGVKKSQTRLNDFHFHWLKKINPLSLYHTSSCVLSSRTSFSVSADRVSFLFFTLYYYDC